MEWERGIRRERRIKHTGETVVTEVLEDILRKLESLKRVSMELQESVRASRAKLRECSQAICRVNTRGGDDPPPVADNQEPIMYAASRGFTDAEWLVDGRRPFAPERRVRMSVLWRLQGPRTVLVAAIHEYPVHHELRVCFESSEDNVVFSRVGDLDALKTKAAQFRSLLKQGWLPVANGSPRDP